MDVRCSSRILFRIENGEIEVQCHSKRCGAGNGVVVLHYYNAETYKPIKTVRYKNPEVLFKKGLEKE